MIHFVHVLRSVSDCTNNGITATHENFLLADTEDEAACAKEVQEKKPEGERLPVLVVVRRTIFGKDYVHAEPIDRPLNTAGPMAGGNYVFTCDSRFTCNVCEYPIAVHDRFETWEDYERFSR